MDLLVLTDFHLVARHGGFGKAARAAGRSMATLSRNMIEEAYHLVIHVNPDPDANLVGRVFLRDRLVMVPSPDLPPPVERRPRCR